MMCVDREVQLNEYVDGTLGRADRAAVEAHLESCAGCREAVAELRALVSGAGALPKSIEPARDLWPPIAVRIVQRVTWNVQRRRWLAMAAAASLIIGVALYRLLPTATVLYRPVKGWAGIQADYEQGVTDLAQTLDLEHDRLAPATVALLERNLAIIDQAIRESRAALARDPGSGDVRQLVAAAYRQKVELLRWVARTATSS
jgi:predicted anti-sigma-YlaC factor YlaD